MGDVSPTAPWVSIVCQSPRLRFRVWTLTALTQMSSNDAELGSLLQEVFRRQRACEPFCSSVGKHPGGTERLWVLC